MGVYWVREGGGMSTSYCVPIEGVTNLRLTEGPVHDRLAIWIEHGLAGELTVPSGWGRRLVCLFSSDNYDDSQDAMRTHWGGSEVGSVVTDRAHLPGDVVLISEYGDVTTAGEVRLLDGAKRSDGMPTELFGYDKAGGTT